MKNRQIIFTTVLSALVCFGLSPGAKAQGPEAPDTALAGGNTADGASALAGLTTGIYNSAFGIFSLLSNGAANFNTGVGAGVLLSSNSTAANLATENTAVGAGALFSNLDGDSNTAVGAFALFSENATGGFPNGVSNNAIGRDAMLFNTTGSFNEALGVNALAGNTAGSGNIAIGDDAGCDITGSGNVTVGGGSCAANTGITSGSGNTVVGSGAGFGITTSSGCVILGAGAGPNVSNLGSNCIYIGAGETSPGGESNTIRIGDGNAASPATACFIGGVTSNNQQWNGVTVCQVTTDAFGHLGFDCVNPNSPRAQAMLNDKVEKLQASNAELRATVAQQQKGMEVLTAQLKEQAAQIQKVSAQLEVNKPAPQVVVNKP